MSVKYTGKNEAKEGTFPPFPVQEKEIVLTGLLLQKTESGDRISLKIDIGWGKPMHLDLAEMEVLVHRGTEDGPVVYWTQESCMIKARFKETISLRAQSDYELFYLTVRSLEQRAIIHGPYSLQGTVHAE